jgi:ribonuclease P protein component
VVHFIPPAGTGHEPAKAGFVVSKAVGGAVLRNKVRRRLRHIVAERLDRLPAGSFDRWSGSAVGGRVGYQAMDLDFDDAPCGRPARSGRQ